MSHYNVGWDNYCEHCLQASSVNLYRLSIKSHKSSLLLVHVAKSQLEMTKFGRLWACCDYQHILYKIYLWTEEPERPERGGLCWLLKLRWMGDSKSTIKEGLPWFVLRACRTRYKRLLSCLGCSGQPSTKYFFLAIHYFLKNVSP